MSQMTQRKQKRSTIRKSRFILPVLIFALSLWPQPNIAQAQWETSGSDIYNTNTGNVGIGMTTPGAKLHVTGNIDTTDGADRKLTLRSSTNYNYALQATGDDFQIIEAPGSSGAVRLHIDYPTGNVGIGTTLPSAKLHVRGPDGMNAIGGPPSIYVQGGSAVNDLTKIDFLNANGGTIGLIAGLVEAAQAYPNSKGSLILGTQNLGSTNEVMRLTGSGNVGIGTTTPSTRLHVEGDVTVTGNIAAKYQDVAEWVTSPKAMPAGTVVILHPEQTNQVLPSHGAYDTRVAGVISEMPGILLGEAGDGKVKVATTGRVKVKVDATKKPVQVGDLLVTSDKEGVAMKSEPLDLGGVPIHRPGTLIGKALEPLKEGEGEILVLLSLQ